MSFEDFVNAIAEIPDSYADKHFKSQHAFLTDSNGYFYTDFCGKLEQIDEDFLTIKKKLGIKNINMPHENKGPKIDYNSFYSQDILKIVKKRYEKDFELFRYPMEIKS